VSKFKYKALDGSGLIVKGELEAATQQLAIRSLSNRRLDIFHITELPPQTRFQIFEKRTKSKDLARYIRQLATLLSAGVSLLEALGSLAKSNAHPALAAASDEIRRDLRSGERLSSAIERHLPALPRYVPRLAELGESTGQSAKALSDAADRMEYEETMRSEIRTALSYPMFLLVVGGAIVFLLFLFVVPRFDALIGNNRDNLPGISKVVIGIGSGLKAYLIPILTLMISGVLGIAYIARKPNLRESYRAIVENMPLIGPVLTQADLGGWSRTMGIALDNGADLLSALKLGEFSIQSKRLRARLQDARTEIRAGRNIDDVLQENIPDFDPLTIDLIRTGRASGNLASMFLFVGRTQEEETREMTKRMAGLAEPVAILGIALIVGTIVISIVLAMTSLYDFAI